MRRRPGSERERQLGRVRYTTIEDQNVCMERYAHVVGRVRREKKKSWLLSVWDQLRSWLLPRPNDWPTD